MVGVVVDNLLGDKDLGLVRAAASYVAILF